MSIVLKNKNNNNIWYKFENRHENFINLIPSSELIRLCEIIKINEQLQVPASTLNLKIKRESENNYTINLDAGYFQNECGNSFRKLIKGFGIKRTNPIKGGISAYFLIFLSCLHKLRDKVYANI